MRIERITNLEENLIGQIMSVWESSVRQTHLFLTDKDIEVYKVFVEKALPNLEMLFVDPEKRGKGIGKNLVKLSIEKFGVKSVDVNEQNHQAVGFYEHMHFRTVARTPNDYKGKPYPILTMQYFPKF